MAKISTKPITKTVVTLPKRGDRIAIPASTRVYTQDGAYLYSQENVVVVTVSNAEFNRRSGGITVHWRGHRSHKKATLK